jgi:hypothetical protein
LNSFLYFLICMVKWYQQVFIHCYKANLTANQQVYLARVDRWFIRNKAIFAVA